MTRFIPASAAIVLMLIFLAINSVIFSSSTAQNRNLRAPHTNLAPADALSIDNDSRGAHSFFLPPRIFTNRLPADALPAPRTFNARIFTNRPPADAIPAQQCLNSSNNSSTYIIPESLRSNAQDLLRLGYLPDNGADYSPAFGVSRNQ